MEQDAKLKLVSGIETLQGAIDFKVRFIIRNEAFILKGEILLKKQAVNER